ncbi:MAG TPA: hypothetical protein VGK93_04235 [Candidatus Eisenbacteria bacterium]|jgi:hypothetical protein
MLRLAAILAMTAGVLGWFGYLRLVGKGPFVPPAARHLRAMKDRLTAPDSLTAVDFAWMTALPRLQTPAEYAPLERRAVSLEAYVETFFRQSDGDFHLELVAHDPGNHPQHPRHVSAEITPQWHRGSSGWRYERLAAALRPIKDQGGPWDTAPRRVRLSGWLLYDYEYEDLPPRRLTNWEIHPVTRIEVWDDSLVAYREFPR